MYNLCLAHFYYTFAFVVYNMGVGGLPVSAFVLYIIMTHLLRPHRSLFIKIVLYGKMYSFLLPLLLLLRASKRIQINNKNCLSHSTNCNVLMNTHRHKKGLAAEKPDHKNLTQEINFVCVPWEVKTIFPFTW